MCIRDRVGVGWGRVRGRAWGAASVRGGNAAREAAVSAVGETKAQGGGKPGDRKNYAELLMSSAPCLLYSGC